MSCSPTITKKITLKNNSNSIHYIRVYAQEHFTDQNGLTSAFNVNVFNWNRDIYC